MYAISPGDDLHKASAVISLSDFRFSSKYLSVVGKKGIRD